jgi:glucosamine--fructose-6-phosphate aminotransferase (isomerizing)
MCGIIGYVGKQSAGPILLEALRRLEYRGYDSAGIAMLNGGEIQVRKRAGRIDDGLTPLVDSQPVHGRSGIGHTRWATHGPPSDRNSHPHLDVRGKIAVVHNGVIENYERLKERLACAGHRFESDTDTEILAHLIGEHYANLEQAPPDGAAMHPLAQAVSNALSEVIGTYGIAVVCSEFPGIIVGARRGSPLIVGIGEGEHFLASDVTAIAPHTRQVVFLKDYDVVTLFADRFSVANAGIHGTKFQISESSFHRKQSSAATFRTTCLKKSSSSRAPLRTHCAVGSIATGHGGFGGLNMSLAELRCVQRSRHHGCGTSWHAGL